ncbi:ABC transporter ATP-binding protein [Sporosarcina sp. Te-1]|uniref:ABC transporter ATP-binding protein n=1 Tax=Sporosarcina sp. Te-1 TaxID=2818390 RepID=UPI001A9F0412|nr:ABC transporter ATP-binding protein [Sporosarcina sp. Te-1]QTD43297.1 ABC transporter ATP-binding protein [Sporosarcina sp. Te-1]
MKTIVSICDLEKNYGPKRAVAGISFTITEGEILGLLGPNGAGKSTTINILSTVLSPDQGDVQIAGHDLRKDPIAIKQKIGIVPQDLAIFEEITAEQNVRFFAGLYKLKGDELDQRVREALELVGLEDRKKEKPKTFSGGMKRRLNIACAIAHQPKLIIMDEPTVGIDPQSRNHILESIKKLRKKGATIIYSTHYMEEVEAIADRIIIMNEGVIIAEGTKEELIQSAGNETIYHFELNNSQNLDEQRISQIPEITYVQLTNNQLTIKTEKSKSILHVIIATLFDNGCTFEKMTSKETSLETVFLDLTGKSLRD